MYRQIFMIGAGAMAEAFIRGVTYHKTLDSNDIVIINRNNPQRLTELHEKYGVRFADSMEAATHSDLIVIAVKPSDVSSALAAIEPYLLHQPILSFAAGVPSSYFRTLTKGRQAIIRTMPNIPVAVLHGVTAVSFDANMSSQQRLAILQLLGPLGEVVEIPEEMMDAATAFTGSGPGFVSYFLEAMENAAIALGFTPSIARKLLLQTVVGTALTLREWDLSPHELRRRVTSPNGTTHAGVTIMQEHNVEEAVKAALVAAQIRAREMGEMYLSKGINESY